MSLFRAFGEMLTRNCYCVPNTHDSLVFAYVDWKINWIDIIVVFDRLVCLL